MALWSRVQKLHGEALQQVVLAYGENFPVDVRSALAQWIEEQPWNELDPNNPQHDALASQLVSNLIKEVELKTSSGDDFLMRLKLSEAVNDFKNKYSSNPQHLVRIIKHCLQTEIRIVQQAENFCNGLTTHMQIIPDPAHEINLTLDKLKHITQEIAEEVRQMQQGQEAFVIQYQESAKRQAQFQQTSSNPEVTAKLQQEKELFEQAVRRKVADLVHLRIKIVEKQQRTFVELSELQKRILDTELVQWKRGQQLAVNGVPFENNLDQIQEWCEGLADIIWQNRQQIRQVENLCSQVHLNVPGDTMAKLPILNSQITNLLSSLVTSTFIIEKQPPQVIVTAKRFTATVRLLVGSKLNVFMTPPQVKVSIISEVQTVALWKNDIAGSGEASGEILNNLGTMEYHQATRQLSVNFKNLQLRKFKRPEKKGTESCPLCECRFAHKRHLLRHIRWHDNETSDEDMPQHPEGGGEIENNQMSRSEVMQASSHSVMDEKFSILFQSQFNVGGGELVFQVWTLSLPVVVIVHGNQEPHAWATVTWDNAFAEPGRIPFQVPDKVPWSKMAEILSSKFKAATGRELMPENLQFLSWKILRSTQVIDNTFPITWSQFCKEPLPERNFTFWEWFYAIMKTTREHLRNLWNDGLILGFISRNQAEDMLINKVSGTFLLRFSDSELGGVTIAWVTDSQQREGSEVLMIQPFTSKDFSIRSLADRIKDLNNLVYLYPDIPKDQTFGKYYTPITENQPSASSPYVGAMLVTQIPSLSRQPGSVFDSYPGTPQSSFMQSTDSGYHDIQITTDMQSGNQYAEMDIADYLMDDPGDFRNIDVNDLLSFSQAST